MRALFALILPVLFALGACGDDSDAGTAGSNQVMAKPVCLPGQVRHGNQCIGTPTPPPPPPTHTCWDGSVIPTTQDCPIQPPPPPVLKTCPDGSQIPAADTCPVVPPPPPPPVQCPDGSTVPAGQACPVPPPPPVTCPDGTVLPAGSTCPLPPPPPPPPVQCPDGTTVPAGQSCPLAPPPPVTASACKPLNMADADHPLPYADMLCTAVRTCPTYQGSLPNWVGPVPTVVQGQPYYVVRGLLWNMDDQHVVAWVPNGGKFAGYNLGGAYFDRSCFDAQPLATPLMAGERG